MSSLKQQLTKIVSDTFVACGFDRHYGEVVISNRPDLSQFQCNGALAAAKPYKMNPRQIAQSVVDRLAALEMISDASIAGPGFININLTDLFLAEHIRTIAADERYGCKPTDEPRKVIVDYGGATIAKPMHVGHLRAAIIGESLKRLALFLGHDTLGDVHLGDWGLPMGLCIAEIQRRQPGLPYFDANQVGPYPTKSPVSIDDLEEIYPAASQRAAEDVNFRQSAQQATFEMQDGRPGYRALRQHFADVSVQELKQDYNDLNVSFELWWGESNADAEIAPLVECLRREGYAQESQGALIVDVTQPDDANEIPPLMLIKSDGAVLYGTTDLATLVLRVRDLQADLVLYVVDKRQSNHFQQVFRAAYKTGVAPATLGLEHIGFGTMNGKDGKPFKTRSGGVMKLRNLIEMVTAKAEERLVEVDAAKEHDATEKAEIARKVGIAALKYADLMNHRTTDYVFDLERFSSFEGRTGPYLLYTAVRTRSILYEARQQGLTFGPIVTPADNVERALLLKIAEVPDMINNAFEQRAPNYLCEYAYELALAFNRFYHDHHILTAVDLGQQSSWLALSECSVSILELVLDLLGIEIPMRM